MITRILLCIFLFFDAIVLFAQTGRPNIVFIMTDDHARRAVSIYDTTLTRTPNIDRIGREGMVFRNAFVTNSLCGPSRAVLLTGKYSHINGFRDNRSRFDPSQQTFPKILRANGYYTAMVGKWHLVSEPVGFDYWNVLIDQGDYYNPDLIEMGDTTRHEGYATSIITDIAIETLEKRRPKDKPFCIFVHQKAPHRNWMPDTTHFGMFDDRDIPMPATYFDDYKGRSLAASGQDMEIDNMWLNYDLKLILRNKSDETGTGGKKTTDNPLDIEMHLKRMNAMQRKAWEDYYQPVSDAFYREKPEGKALSMWKYQRYIKDYLRCIASVDDNVGRLLAYLEKENLLDNTIIVYTSDQGFFTGEHGWYDKRFMYEPSMSIPLVIRYPPAIKAGTSSEALALNLDFAPTLLDLAGLTPPADMQGASLRPLFANGSAKGWRRSMYYHYYEYPYGWHYVKKHYGVRTDRYKLIHFYNDNDEWELYDLKNDPGEMHNLYGDKKHTREVKKLKKELKRLRAQYRDHEPADRP
ncbi:MAG: sulfatase [Lewinellaceae bacterium]|nr:sulfatase [Saprospiraceae bacterium]MCB9305363.1 sulfatase [Lewinellaceae bacterium]MCB9355996.1 sulfatase [Lewinellaceae bacterium]